MNSHLPFDIHRRFETFKAHGKNVLLAALFVGVCLTILAWLDAVAPPGMEGF